MRGGFAPFNAVFVGADGRIRRLSPRTRRALRRAARAKVGAEVAADPEKPARPERPPEPPKGKPEPPRRLTATLRETALRLARSRFSSAEIARLLRVTQESVERALKEKT